MPSLGLVHYFSLFTQPCKAHCKGSSLCGCMPFFAHLIVVYSSMCVNFWNFTQHPLLHMRKYTLRETMLSQKEAINLNCSDHSTGHGASYGALSSNKGSGSNSAINTLWCDSVLELMTMAALQKKKEKKNKERMREEKKDMHDKASIDV